jgi:hypothetical protein
MKTLPARVSVVLLGAIASSGVGCQGGVVAKPAATSAPGATTPAPAPKPAPAASKPAPAPAAPAAATGAQLVSVEIPSRMYAGQMAPFYVTLTNTGQTTWDDTFRLGVVGDLAGDGTRFLEDPALKYPDADRVHLPAGVTVAAGQTYTFAFVGKAPSAAAYDVKFQMIETPSTWFGPVAEQMVTVGPALAPGTIPPDVVDLSQATVYNSPPDVASWPATTMITTLDIEMQGFQVLFDKRDGPGSWPDYTPPGFGGPIEYTLWSVERIGGKWQTSGVIQIWRDPSDGLWIGGNPSGLAIDWYYDPGRWGPLSGYQPAVGEPVGFFVTAGNARNVTAPGATSVLERSNVVIVPFPADTGATFTFP